jgi:dGTPase
MNAREILEEKELKFLAPYAVKSSLSIGRTLHGNEFDEQRTCFQRDRDRVLYSTAFKRLQYKTQVFVIHEGDFYRTRMTHTLEVVQHARTLARTLQVNEDLCEAIALAHDLGHTPFGHSGEDELNELMKNDGGFDHNIQSLRIVDSLERRYAAYNGLNLTFEVREGIARHHTPYDNPPKLEEFNRYPSPSLESQIVNLADVMAYSSHDLEDAFEAGYVTLEQVEALNCPLWQDVLRKTETELRNYAITDRLILHRLVIRNLISTLNIDVTKHTLRNLALWNVKSVDEVRNLGQSIVQFSPGLVGSFNQLREFLFNEVYKSAPVSIICRKSRMMIKEVFQNLLADPRQLPPRTYEKFKLKGNRVIADFIAGMTDRYALDFHQMMFSPRDKVLSSFKLR